MDGRIVPICQLSDRDVRAWRDLAEHAIEPNPLFEAECLIPAAHNLPNGEQISLVIAEDEGRFLGCFPVLRVGGDTKPSSSWAGVRRPAFTTQVRRLRYDGTPLIRGERGVEAATALLSALTDQAHTRDAGILVLEALDTDGPVSSYFRSAAKNLGLPLYAYRTWERPIVRRRDELTYRNSYEGKSDRKLAKLRRQLGDKLGGDVQFVDRSADASAVEELIAMEAAGYKLENGVALVSHPGEPEWFREMCAHFRESGRLLVYSLQVGDSVVAMDLSLRAGEGLFGLLGAYDEDYSRFAPGIQLWFEVIERFHNETDARWLDSCTYAGNETLLRLLPDRRTVSTVLVAVGGPLARWRFRLYATALDAFGVGSTFRSRHPRACGALDRVLVKLGLLSF